MNRNLLAYAILLAGLAVVFAGLRLGRSTAVTVSQELGSISGHITYTDGRAVARYPVDYWPLSAPEKRDRARTGDDGRYSITGLEDGEYWVGMFHPSRLPADKNPRVEDVAEAPPALQEVGTPKGQRVSVSGGKAVENVDFVLVDDGSERQDTTGIEVGPDLTAPQAGGSDGGSSVMRLVILVALGGVSLVLGVGRIAVTRKNDR